MEQEITFESHPISFIQQLEQEIEDNHPSRLTSEDIEDVSDNYQAHLEYKWWKDEQSELIKDFYDLLKGVSSGYASLSYELADYRIGDLVKLQILINGEVIEAFSRIVPREKAREIGLVIIEKLKEKLEPELFPVPIQAAINSEIIARVTLPALKKNVTSHLYGGDRSRKMKLWQKQKRGKKRLSAQSNLDLPPEIFHKLYTQE